MRIIFDTNIFIDILLQQEPFYEKSFLAIRSCQEKKVEGFLPASSLTDIFYIVTKRTHNKQIARQAIDSTLKLVDICPVTKATVVSAHMKNARDFEDALVAACGESIHADAIITRNKKDFDEFAIPSLSPDELLELLAKQA